MSWAYDAWVQAMYDVGYNGYVNYEACTPTYLSNGKLVPIEVIDERGQMGRDFMKQLSAEPKPREYRRWKRLDLQSLAAVPFRASAAFKT